MIKKKLICISYKEDVSQLLCLSEIISTGLSI